MWILKNRKPIIYVFGLIVLASLAALPYLSFSFDFERFFPEGDADLEYYKGFVEEFESDDNYLLVALTHESNIFDSIFIHKVKQLTLEIPKLPFVISAISIPTLQRPRLKPFGFDFEPIFNLDSAQALSDQYDNLVQNQSTIKSLVAPNKKSLVVALKIEEHLQIDGSNALIKTVKATIKNHGFSNYHLLGRAYFQKEIARHQLIEVLYSSILSFLMVSIILFLLYRNKYLIFITLVSITLGLIVFLGLLSLLGREMDAMSALYPVLMLIVGSSDVIHILSKYLDELRLGKGVGPALDTSIRQIGLATLFTSLTTAIGFVSLITSRISPVREFGLNAAIGVLVAYLTIIFFTTALLTYFSPEKLKAHSRTFELWDKIALWFYRISKSHFSILTFSFLLLVSCIYGINQISTDYKIESSLPKGKKVTTDFLFFEKNYSGYRPVEYVLSTKNNQNILDSTGLVETKNISDFIKNHPSVESVNSVATLMEMIQNTFVLPGQQPRAPSFEKIKPVLMAALKASPSVLINKDENKIRISAQIKDIGAYKIKAFTNEIRSWSLANLDTSTYDLTYTGTGLIIDKNAVYVRESLLKGLGLALLIIGILMGFLFRSVKMVFVSLVPNAIPLLIAAAILGFSEVPLDPLTSITFVVIFGIAVDDTIHFLSKYRLALHGGLTIEESIKSSFEESGKAILFTTVVLFFGFSVMLFSYNPASVIVGGLISITLFTAVFADLIILPILLRVFQVK